MSDSLARCPHCAEAIAPTDEFCENCGNAVSEAAIAASTKAGADATEAAKAAAIDRAASPLPHVAGQIPTGHEAGGQDTNGPVCASCGGAIADDGYCTQCGAKERTERDHWTEQPVAWIAGVCDRGIRHHRNEDAMAMIAQPELGSFGALIVCDGVSTASNSDVASLAAARAAVAVFGSAAHPQSATVSSRITHWTTVIENAAAAGQAEVCTTETTELGPDLTSPACTFVTAVVDHGVVTVGWVGDSRAYWFPDGGAPEALSIDHSVASDDIARGVSRAVAETGNLAHAITRWLGNDTPTAVPQCLTTTVNAAGWLLLCSDGLWNYCSAAPDLGVLLETNARAAVDDGSVFGDPLPIAQRLTTWANAQGGHDNITVVLARIPSPKS